MVRKEDGQSLVEFALILPLFLLLLAGVIDFGRILYTHMQLELISQESVRLGGLGKTDDEIRAYAQNQFTQGDSSLLAVNISPSGTRKSGTYVSVDMSYPETLFEALGSMAVPYTIKTSSTIRVE